MTQTTPSDSFPRFQVITKLGQGGMARVLLMLSRGSAGVNKLLVVKEMLPALYEDPEILTMFLDEARLAVRLNHPNVVQTYEVNTDGERPLIVMEYLEGHSLTAVLNHVGRANISMELHLYILTQVLVGLHHAHELCDFDGTPLGVVHRDVSPQNVLVTYDGQVKIVDFGIAKAAGADSRTRTGVFKGKMSYASPEQITRAPIDRRCDIFAAGVMLWEALARRRFASSEFDIAIMQQRIDGSEPKIQAVAPETPDELARICDRAMANEPDDRYATAEDFRVDLAAYLDNSKRVGVQDLAALMRTAFAEDRAKIRRIIDVRMKEISTKEPGATGNTATSPATNIAEGQSMGTQARIALASEPETGRSASRLRAAAAAPPAAKIRGRILLGAGILGAGVVTLLLFARRAPVAAGGANSAQPQAPPTAPAAAAAATVNVTIAVDPPEARVFLDGVEIATNPFRGTLPSSAQTRRVRAAAPGFAPEERLMVFDRDLQVQMALKPAPTASAAPPAPGHPRITYPTRHNPAETPAQAAAAAAPASPQTAPAAPTPGEAVSPTSRKPPRSIDDNL